MKNLTDKKGEDAGFIDYDNHCITSSPFCGLEIDEPNGGDILENSWNVDCSLKLCWATEKMFRSFLESYPFEMLLLDVDR